MVAGCFASRAVFAQLMPIDSLKQELRLHPKPDTNRVVLLNLLSNQYISIDYQQVKIIAEEALKLAEKLSYQAGIANAKNRLALCYHMIGEDELAIQFALSAESIAEKNQMAEALAESYRILGSAYMNQEDLKTAENYHIRAEKMARKTKNRRLLARILNGAGTVQFRKQNDLAALKLYQQSLGILREENAIFFMPIALSNIGEIYSRPTLRNPALERQFFEEALFYALKSKNRFAEGSALSNLGMLFTTRNNYPKAERYLSQALKLSQETGTRSVTTRIYLHLVELNMKRGKSPQAQKYLKSYYDLRDSLQNEKRTRQIVRLEAQYKSEKKEQQIKLLEQEKRFYMASKNFWIGGSVLLFIAVIIIYYLLQSRNRKAGQLLEVQQTLIEKLRETDLLKSRFFATISHEFRTPLALILAPLEEMLLAPRSSPVDPNDLKLVKRNANRLLDLVNQLLDLSKLEAGKMSLQIQTGDLETWLRLLVSSFDSLAEARGIQFIKRMAVSSDNTWFDPDKLEKIVTNILSNAFKFTGPGGSVALSIQTSDDASDLFITLTDTGKGIPEEDLPHIFSPFYQSRKLADDGQPGTGLGLALVNELVKLHKGEIDFASQLNTGTTISITLPVSREKLDFAEAVFVRNQEFAPKPQTADDFPAVETEPDAGTSDCLLVVEDNPELRNFIVTIFQNQFRVVTAQDGEEGLQLAVDLLPDLIISDVMMPKMDGIGLTERIRTNDLTSHIPVLLLTAKSDAESRMDGFRTGADDYLIKPFSTEELRVRVANLVEQRKKLAAKYRSEIWAPASPTRTLSYDEKFVISLRAVVETHLSDSSFSVEQLAEEMCLSRTQLFRKVKALLEISPNELINDIRLQRAAELIRSKADSLTQISYSVGFSEQSYFAKRFRKKFGVSPGEYANA
ncbi:ATP-binding protein [Larkinella terrae]|nr:ATP-binding protein [Larkinella terrae]